jgi:hypothetical protein
MHLIPTRIYAADMDVAVSAHMEYPYLKQKWHHNIVYFLRCIFLGVTRSPDIGDQQCHMDDVTDLSVNRLGTPYPHLDSADSSAPRA